MTQDKIEELMIKNTVAIGELVVLAKNTTDDVDKLVQKMETYVKHEKVEDIEKKIEILKPFIVMATYKKATVCACVGLYVIAVSDSPVIEALRNLGG